jgi:excisionase family DNA binding protein
VKDQTHDVLTIEEAAEYLQISQSTLYKEAQKGKIPCKKIGKRWRFSRKALENWLDPMTAHPVKVEMTSNKSRKERI